MLLLLFLVKYAHACLTREGFDMRILSSCREWSTKPGSTYGSYSKEYHDHWASMLIYLIISRLLVPTTGSITPDTRMNLACGGLKLQENRLVCDTSVKKFIINWPYKQACPLTLAPTFTHRSSQFLQSRHAYIRVSNTPTRRTGL